MVGLPAVVSWKKKLPAPPLIDTEVIVPSKGPTALVSKNMDEESEERLAVPVKVVTWLSNTSRISKVTTAEGTPDTLGGRENHAATISFQLPSDVGVHDLPGRFIQPFDESQLGRPLGLEKTFAKGGVFRQGAGIERPPRVP